jgi:hypothetical protein
MENTVDFSRNLIKGRIAEIIFEQMFRESGKFTILRSGYEYTFPELAQYRQLPEVERYLKKIRHNVDFILISHDGKEAYLVEVKYRTNPIAKDIEKVATETREVQDPSWLFMATPKGFFFEPCNTVLRNNGKIGQLYDKWVSGELQEKYLKLMNEFQCEKDKK